MALLRLALVALRLAAAHALRHAAVTAGLWLLAVLALLIGTTGLLVAIWIGLARLLDPLSAALVIGCAGLAIGAALLLVVRMRQARPLIAPSVTAEIRSALAQGDAAVKLGLPLLLLALLGFAFASKEKPEDPPTPEA